MRKYKKRAAKKAKNTPRPTRKLTFMDLPAEIRNQIYELYSKVDRQRLSSPPKKPPPKRNRKNKNLKKKAKNENNTYTHSPCDKYLLLLFMPSIIRVNRQIRKEYVSLIFHHVVLRVRIAPDLHLWNRFANVLGDDVIKQITKLEILSLPGGCGFGVADSGHVSVCISLLNLQNPVEWQRQSCSGTYDSSERTKGGWRAQLLAAKGIQSAVLGVGVKDGKRTLSRLVLEKILRYATLKEVYEDMACQRKALLYCLLAISLALWVHVVLHGRRSGWIVPVTAMFLTQFWVFEIVMHYICDWPGIGMGDMKGFLR